MERFDPARPDFSPYGFSCVRWTPTKMPRFDRHNEVELNLLESGSLIYLMGGSKVTISAGRLAVFWAGIPHQILDFECLPDYYVVTIPLAWFLQWRLPDRFTQAILHGATILEPDANALATDQGRFEMWSADALAASQERRHASLLEIEARLRRLALSLAGELPAAGGRRSPTGLDDRHGSLAERMAGFIAQRYTEPLSAREIGEHVGLHSNYAMALFQQTFGTTLVKYVTEHRLSHAQRLLATTGRPIVDIAFESGFGSLSRFNEAFRRSFHCTPREYRRSHQGP